MVPLFLTVLFWIPFYFLGSCPTGYLIAKRNGINLTAKGSGNIGATNVARVLGVRAGLLTLAVDVLKGIISVFIAMLVSGESWFIAGAAVATVAGHCFSIPTKLKGGKGVATSLGVALALNTVSALTALLVFIAIFFTTRIVSIASLSAAFAAPLASLLLDAPSPVCTAFMLISLLIAFRHRSNLARIAQGTEPRFSTPQAR